MKTILIFLLVLFFAFYAKSQTVSRRINFHITDRDSVNLPLNDEYYLIEDSCAQIFRHARLNLETRKFFGKFTDVSKADPNFIVSEGYYSEDGLKNGEFKSYYLNGKLRGKGSFKNNKYNGKWEMYYEDGQPELTFEVVDGETTIIDAWKPDGKKTVESGKGTYVDNLGGFYWKGKLLNGKPDGTWRLINADDATETPLASEYFKKGKFHDGSRGGFNYTDASHIEIVSLFKLPFVNIEKILVSAVPCNGTKPKHIVGAQYENGLSSFSSYISDAVMPYFSRVNLKGIERIIEIEGEVSEKGGLINLKSNRSDSAMEIAMRLRNLPVLHPATVDGRPVKQKFVITFRISSGYYQFTYRFLPVQAN